MSLKTFLHLCLLSGLALTTAGLWSCNTGEKAGAPKGRVSIIPLPASISETADSFLLDKKTVIIATNESDKKTAALFNTWLRELTGYELAIQDKGDKNAIILHSGSDSTNGEGYTLIADHQHVAINGNSSSGTFYGIQTLIQLLPVEKTAALYIPGVNITDAPRFPYRGMHLDVGRHFFSVEFVKKYIDLLAMHKFNTFHWHLTEDQGWRIEIKKYPRLQEISSKRKETMAGKYADNKFDGKPYGGYYTQDQIKDVVKYAADRFVTIIPEIEMPGHSLAVLAAYPNLGCTGGPYEVGTRWGVYDDVYCAGNDSVYLFLQDVLDEVMALFPSKYIHIGGDECPKVRWEKCPKCQARMKQEGLKDAHALQSYFIQRMEKYLNSKGRQIIGWDEILEGGLAPNASVMSWRGVEGGIAAAKQHHNVIMTPGDYCYFDHYQSRSANEPLAIGGFLPVSQVYSYEPVPAELNKDEAQYIKGAQANLWTEYIGNTDYLEYMAYPRAAALAEVVWSPKDKRNYDNFAGRLKWHVKRLDLKKVNYAKHVFEVKGKIAGNGKGAVTLTLSSILDNARIFFSTDSTAPTPQSTPYTQPIQIAKTGTVRAQVFLDGKPFGNEYNQTFRFHKGLAKKVTMTPEADKSHHPESTFVLVNGIEGNASYSDNEWFGFKGTGMEAVVELDSVQDIHGVGINIINAKGDWIYPPKEVVFAVSEDGKTYKEVYKQTTFTQNGINRIRGTLQQVRGKFVKVKMQNFGTIPAGAAGAGSPAWLFADEFIID
ncbi:family 20 glycosylhydrolase [Chitinophaga sp. 212800010-3]|uniref:beta-N-acetylhexosaminidase n=1 Tax=unclassified Chitinophaga TaxID=2619133 RepID=UPI002DF00972|nr:Hexosaminidase [Chitinophaga sp. 212800010-3]